MEIMAGSYPSRHLVIASALTHHHQSPQFLSTAIAQVAKVFFLKDTEALMAGLVIKESERIEVPFVYIGSRPKTIPANQC